MRDSTLGHWLARYIINSKRKVGLGNPRLAKGVKKKTTENESRLKKIMARGTS